MLEAQRLEQRTHYDIEMMEELGYCSGIENYSRHLTGRKKGQRPYTLIDYFPKDYITIIDESHATLPQVRGMYEGDKSRKKTLVEFGFRLPSALDNRPLHFDEFLSLINQAVFVSATPGDFELEKTNGVYVEQVIRPTGLIDPKIYIRPVKGQIDDLIEQIKKTTDRKERVLVTTLTKRMAEDLADYLSSLGIKVRYMHSEIGTLERVEILRELRLGEFDVLVGINLLREGLDLPEVSLVAILDADKEGFLRSERSLLQTAGRAARNIRGTVILYADVITKSMQKLMDVTDRRRKIQRQHNEEHDITPETIYKSVNEVLISTSIADERAQYTVREKSERKYSSEMEKEEIIEQLESEMIKASRNLAFERAAEIRDEIGFLKNDPKFKNKN